MAIYLVIHLALGQPFGAGLATLPLLLAIQTVMNLGLAHARRHAHRLRARRRQRADLHQPRPAVHHAGDLPGLGALADAPEAPHLEPVLPPLHLLPGGAGRAASPPAGGLVLATVFAIVLLRRRLPGRSCPTSAPSRCGCERARRTPCPAIEVEHLGRLPRARRARRRFKSSVRELLRLDEPPMRLVPALRDVSFTVPKGTRARRHRPQRRRQVHAAARLAGILAPTEGRVTVRGRISTLLWPWASA